MTIVQMALLNTGEYARGGSVEITGFSTLDIVGYRVNINPSVTHGCN